MGTVRILIIPIPNPEGPYILPLWNSVTNDQPRSGFGDLIAEWRYVYMDPLGDIV